MKKSSLLLQLFFILQSSCAYAVNTYTVTNTNDSGSGSLRQAILEANATGAPGGVIGTPPIINTIQVNVSGNPSPTISLEEELPLIFSYMNIRGGAGGGTLTLSGLEASRGLFVSGLPAPSSPAWPPQKIIVTLSDIQFQNFIAEGGIGSGGGMGAGGALFVNQMADVILENVSFTNNSAIGGDGSGLLSGGGGLGGDGGGNGGGGIKGTGGNSGIGAGGGGIGGSGGEDDLSGGGGFGGTGIGQISSSQGLSSAGNPNGGAEGGGRNGGGGGANTVGEPGDGSGQGGKGGSEVLQAAGGGGSGGQTSANENGGNGGIGGGGGGGRSKAGVGGFGGGGAGGYQGLFANGADGGFGGGGGGVGKTLEKNVSGGVGGFGGGGGSSKGSISGISGGFGGGAGATRGTGSSNFGGGGAKKGAGGGGAAMGGSIFVVGGGTLTIQGSSGSLSGGTLRGGSGEEFGQVFGNGIFLNSSINGETLNGTLRFNPEAGATFSYNDDISDQTGSGGTGSNVGSWGLTLTGAPTGTLILGGNNTYSGQTTVNTGTLKGNLSPNSTLNLSKNTTYTLSENQTSGGLAGEGNVILGSNTLTTGGNNDSTTFSGSLSGTGGLIKTGTGILTLSGKSNSYTGGTTINGGTLNATLPANQILNLNAAGATFVSGANQTIGGLSGVTGSTVNLNGGILTINNNADTTFNGLIMGGNTGEGGLSKTGTGTLTLTVSPTYTGTTIINEGTLEVIGGTLPTTQLELLGGAYPLSSNQEFVTLIGFNRKASITLGLSTTPYNLTILGDNSNNVYEFSGTISGTGKFIVGRKSTSGIISLFGNNSYAGGTRIFSGSQLIGNVITLNGITTGSLPPTGPITANGTLVFNQKTVRGHSISGVFAGSIFGLGNVIVEGGNVIFTGSISSTITTTTQNGGSITSNANNIVGNIVDNGVVIFSQTSAGTYKGSISGSGSLIKKGKGALTLAGISPLTGSTTVSEGALDVQGGLPNSLVIVDKLAALKGAGKVGSAHIKGKIMPGNSIGVIEVINDLVMGPTSTYEAEVSVNGSDTIQVGGKAKLSGILDLRLFETKRPQLKNKSFTILTTGQRREGIFTPISKDRIKYTVQYSTNKVQALIGNLQDFVDASSPASKSNIARTERYFDTFADNTAGRPDLTHVINILDGLLLTENTALVNNA
ncbi:MAG: autotransporter-associated beta strand repeat-containing protein, partial [Alphaproteobacteria bacterium]|nr:autotransporter-associated beta strand repeat-containing protein [Alphaproteobacteria bacterium]